MPSLMCRGTTILAVVLCVIGVMSACVGSGRALAQNFDVPKMPRNHRAFSFFLS